MLTPLAKARRLRNNPTCAKASFWELVRKRRVLNHRFLRQYIIPHDGSTTAYRDYIVDFYCDALRLVIEIDGTIHDDETQAAYDRARETYLSKAGFTVLCFTNEAVLTASDDVRDKLRTAISEIDATSRSSSAAPGPCTCARSAR